MKKLQSLHPLMVLGDAADMDFRELAAFNGGKIGIFRSGPGVSPWEYHPDHDELLYVLDGAVTITVLTDVDETDILVEKGFMLVIPRGHWHRHTVQDLLVEMYVSPAETRHSMSDDPRIDP